MQLDQVNEQGDVEDARGSRRPLAIGGGLGAVAIALIAGFLGINPQLAQQFAQMLGGGGEAQDQPVDEAKAPHDGYKKFSETILGSANGVWREQFRDPKNGINREYEPPKMRLFSEGVNTGCGSASSNVGPFYCPVDKKVYLDPTFFDELANRLHGSKAEFSQAYVITHEVGHHVQNLIGYNDLVDKYRRSEGENAGVRLELQADYLAGVWAHYADQKYHILKDPKEVQEALTTARAIGDDTLQKGAGRPPAPESFTHGTSKQRYHFFDLGFRTGDCTKKTLDKFFDRNKNPLKLGEGADI